MFLLIWSAAIHKTPASQWLIQAITIPSAVMIHQSPLPDLKDLSSLYISIIRHTPSLQRASLFFSLFLSGLDTPIIRIQGYFSNALEQLLRTQAQLFLSQSVLSVMNRGMSSSYISVREKNLKLLWTAAETYPRLLTLYLPVLIRGCSDRGISVRKVSYRLTNRLLNYLLQRGLQEDSRETLLAVRLYRLTFNTLTSPEDATIQKLCLESVADAWLLKATQNSSLLVYLAKIARNTTARINEVKAESGSAITRVEKGLNQLGEVFKKQEKYLHICVDGFSIFYEILYPK